MVKGEFEENLRVFSVVGAKTNLTYFGLLKQPRHLKIRHNNFGGAYGCHIKHIGSRHFRALDRYQIELVSTRSTLTTLVTLVS
jgi:hypothetical protein